MAESYQLSTAISQLPLPLAQTLRRAVNAKSPHEQHNGAYYFFESTLKLAAAAQVGIYLATDNSDSRINEMIEALTRPSVGHWLGMLREISKSLAGRKDAGLLPLEGLHDRLSEKATLPAASAFLKFAAEAAGTNEGRQKLRPLDLLDGIVSYRNAELGHGAQRERSFYAQAAPLLVDAVLELIEVARPFGNLQLAVARDVLDSASQKAERKFEVLRGDGLHLPLDGEHEDDANIPAGRIVLAQAKARIQLHPLLVYEVDNMDRDRVGFLNKVATRGRGDTALIKRVEYLDYDSGERLEAHDAVEELAGLLTKVRGATVSVDTVENMTRAEAMIETEAEAPESGQWIGDFELISELGRGGMGIVYEALQGSLKRHVALKVLPPGIAGDPIAVARFKREIAALGRCDHPNVVKVLTAGQQDDRHYYAMEYVEGSDLSEVFGVLSSWRMQTEGELKEGHLQQAISNVVSSRGSASGKGAPESADDEKISVPEKKAEAPAIEQGRDYYTRIAEILADAARGVEHLHDHGIIHRDLKPANIMLTSDSKRAVIMDLGLAQVQDRSLSLTASSVKILGTLRYMPPEQLQHNLLEVTPKADIYSLGATLYELAVLAPIFDGDSEAKLISQVLQQEPKAPRSLNSKVPKDLETIITVATAKNPNERYATAAHLADDLERFAKGEPITARPPSTFHYLKLFYRKNRALVHTSATALMIMLALAGVFLQQMASALTDTEEQRVRAVAAEGDARELLSQAEKERKKAEQSATDAKLARKEADTQRDLAQESATEAEAALTEANRNLIRVHEEKANGAEEGKRMRDALAHRVEAARLATESDNQTLLRELIDRVEQTDAATPYPVWTRNPEAFDGLGEAVNIDAQCVAAVRFDQTTSTSGRLILYDVRTGAALSFTAIYDLPRILKLSPGGKHLLLLYDSGVIELRQTENLSAAIKIDVNLKAEVFNGIGFSRDGDTFMLVMGHERMRVLSSVDGTELHRRELPEPLKAARFFPAHNAVVFATVDDRSTVVMDTESCEILGRLDQPDWLMSLSPDRQSLLQTAYGENSKLWALNFDPPTFREFDCRIEHVAFSPDGNDVVGWCDGRLTRVDTGTGKTVWKSGEKLFGWTAPRFHPNGVHLLVGTVRRGLTVVDFSTGEIIASPLGHPVLIAQASTSPDGRFLATLAYDGRIILWDAWSGNHMYDLGNTVGRLRPIWSPDGRYLITGAKNGVRRFDVLNGFQSEVFSIGASQDTATRATHISPDGRFVFGCFTFWRDSGEFSELTTIAYWNIATGELAKKVEVPDYYMDMAIETVSAAEGPRLIMTLVGASSGGVHFDALSIEKLSEFSLPHIYTGSLSSNGRHAVVIDNVGKIWLVSIKMPGDDWAGNDEVKAYPLIDIVEETNKVTGTGFRSSFSADSQTLFISDPEKGVFSWDVTSRDRSTKLAIRSPVALIAASPDAQTLFTSSFRGELTCWQIPHSESGLVAKCDAEVLDLLKAPDGESFYVGSVGDKGVRHLHGVTGETIRKLEMEEGVAADTCVGLSMSPDGRLLASGSVEFDGGKVKECRIWLWDLETGKLRHVWELPDGKLVFYTAFSADSSKVFASTTEMGPSASGGKVFVFRISDQEKLKTFDLPDAGVVSFVLNSDQSRMVTMDTKKRLTLWDVENTSQINQFNAPHKSDISFPVWNPYDGLVYASNTQGSVTGYNPESGKAVMSFEASPGVIYRLRTIHGGRFIAASGKFKEVPIWDCKDGSLTRTISYPFDSREVAGLDTSDDGTIYVGSKTEIVRFTVKLLSSPGLLHLASSTNLAAWGERRTQRRVVGLELSRPENPSLPINWLNGEQEPPPDWPTQSADWMHELRRNSNLSSDWATQTLDSRSMKWRNSTAAGLADSWERKFEGYRYRIEVGEDGKPKRFSIPKRKIDSNGQLIGEAEGYIDYAKWYVDHVGSLPSTRPRIDLPRERD